MTTPKIEAVAWMVGDEAFPSESLAIEEIRQWGPSGSIAKPVYSQQTVDALLAEVERLAERNAELEGFRKHCDLLTHKLITCGVAASHSDASLSTRGAYGGMWDSPQAQDVRALRARAERAEAQAEANRRDAERYRYIAADHSLAWEEELDAAIGGRES